MSWDPMDHTLPLEDVQRLYLGLEVGLYDAEPMEFSAETVAAMLQSVLSRSREEQAIVIHAIVRALRGDDQHHRLELRQARKGKHKMAHHFAADRKRNREWLEKLASLERDGMKTEAAIAAIAEQWGVKRATVFAGIKAAETVLDMGRSIDRFSGKGGGEYENPRPSKSALD